MKIIVPNPLVSFSLRHHSRLAVNHPLASIFHKRPGHNDFDFQAIYRFIIFSPNLIASHSRFRAAILLASATWRWPKGSWLREQECLHCGFSSNGGRIKQELYRKIKVKID